MVRTLNKLDAQDNKYFSNIQGMLRHIDSLASGDVKSDEKEVLEALKEMLVDSNRALETARDAAHSAAGTLRYEWGHLQFYYGHDGIVQGLEIEDTVRGPERFALLKEARAKYLSSNFEYTLRRSIPNNVEHMYMPQEIRRAEEAALRLSMFVDAYKVVKQTRPESSEYYYLRTLIQNMLTRDPGQTTTMVGGQHVNPAIFRGIRL